MLQQGRARARARARAGQGTEGWMVLFTAGQGKSKRKGRAEHWGPTVLFTAGQGKDKGKGKGRAEH